MPIDEKERERRPAMSFGKHTQPLGIVERPTSARPATAADVITYIQSPPPPLSLSLSSPSNHLSSYSTPKTSSKEKGLRKYYSREKKKEKRKTRRGWKKRREKTLLEVQRRARIERQSPGRIANTQTFRVPTAPYIFVFLLLLISRLPPPPMYSISQQQSLSLPPASYTYIVAIPLVVQTEQCFPFTK